MVLSTEKCVKITLEYTTIMLNKNTLFLFIGLSIGLWVGLSFPLFSNTDASFTEQLMNPGNIIGAVIGGVVGSIVYYFMSKKKQQ